MTAARSEARAPLVALAALSAVLLAVRGYAAREVGFGDSEALYAAYALHPQPAYLDHPGLVGLLMRALGGGLAPSPAVVHRVTALAATLVPWLAAGAARATGATWRASLLAAIAVAVTPEIAVGLFALTPDLPLAFAWLGVLALASIALRAVPSSGAAAASFLFAGLLAGVACAAKASGALLVVALIVAYASRPARSHAKTPWPWLGLATGALVVAPIAAYEAQRGFPMLQHRLVDTQHDAGLSLRNLGALVFGQVAYVSPGLLVVAVLVAIDLWRHRSDDDPVTRLLFAAFVLPLAALVPLALWSRVAEPHWIAPALLALPLYAARAPSLTRRSLVPALAIGGAFVAIAHAWVLVPASARLVPEADEKYDLANELYGWPRAIAAVRDVLDESRMDGPYGSPEETVPVIVGPHWVVCAQLEAALNGEAHVGCDGPSRDDFDDWLPRALWHRADALLFVSDDRFPSDVAERFPHRYAQRVWHVPVARGGRVVRTFELTLLLPRAIGFRE